jgi:hypothetical protein
MLPYRTPNMPKTIRLPCLIWAVGRELSGRFVMCEKGESARCRNGDCYM